MESLRPAQVKQHFFEDNTDFTEIHASEAKVIQGFQDIHEDEDEIWLLQCPKGMDVKELEGHKLKFPGRIKIKDYEAISMEATTPKTMAFGYSTRKHKYDVKLLPIAGRIVLSEQITTPHNITEESLLECRTSSSVPLPEYIKLRHPLLGSNFDEHLKCYAKRKTSLTNGKKKTINKSEHTSHKRNHAQTTAEESVKKSKSSSSEKRKKSSSGNVDVSDDLRWLKEF